MNLARSGSDGFIGVNGLIACFETQTVFDFLFHELNVFEEVTIGFDALIAGNLYDFYAVVASVDAGSDTKGAGKETILDAFCAVVEGGSRFAQFAVDADGGAEGPAAGVAEERR